MRFDKKFGWFIAESSFSDQKLFRQGTGRDGTGRDGGGGVEIMMSVLPLLTILISSSDRD